MNVTRTILLGLVPFAALIFFNVKIYERIKITRRRYSRNNNNTSQQAKDLQLGFILILVCVMFFLTNLPRLLLNLYELYKVDDIIECGDQFFPPTWFICSTSVNHLLLVLNCIMNFIVYCCFNEKFKHILFQQQDKNQQNNSSPQQNQQIPSRNAEPKQRNITRVTGVIQTNFNHDPKKETIKLSNLTLPDVTNTTKFLAQTDELPPQQSLIKSETMTTTV